MKNGLALTLLVLGFYSFTILQSCGNSDKKNTAAKTDTVKPVRVNPEKVEETKIAEKPATINILDTVTTKRTVIYMKDSAKTFERISLKLAQIYGVKLAEVLKKNNLKITGAPMAWYKSSKAPYFFEAGIPVSKKPAKF